MERLSDRFGGTGSGDLASVLMETAENAVEDNLPDYLTQLKDCIKDSLLEELDDFNIEVIYKRLAINSVAFQIVEEQFFQTKAAPADCETQEEKTPETA